jgi:predicted phosphodiesterase
LPATRHAGNRARRKKQKIFASFFQKRRIFLPSPNLATHPSMKFLHAADIHLDSPLAGLRARADIPEAVIAHCTRRAFSAMVDLAIAEDVAFVVIAGDLYDGDWKDFSTGLFFAAEMRRLARPCFLLRGNHDARSVITGKLVLPGNVREFSSRSCETFLRADLGVALHGHSFPNRAVPEDLSAGYPAPVPGVLNIGVLHTSAEDRGAHELYAPCAVGALVLKGYEYWALGHVHARQILHERPYVVFPGNLQGRHANETGPKGCVIVTVEDGIVVDVAHRPVDVLRWASLAVQAGGVDEAGLLERLAAAVIGAAEAAQGRPVLARVTVSGGPAAGLAGDPERLAAECHAAAIEAGVSLHVERVRLRPAPAGAASAGLLEPLRAAFAASLEDPALVARLLADFAELRQMVPAAGRAGLELPEDRVALAALAGEAWHVALEALGPPAGPEAA